MHQLVFSRAELCVTGIRSVARTVDERLRVLDAEADGKRLRLYIDTAIVKHFEGIARAVAYRQHHMVGRDMFTAAKHDAAHLPVVDIKVVDPALKADFAAQRVNAFAHSLHHANQPERTDVRLAHVEDFRRRAGLDEFRQHLAPEVARVLDLAVQLAVRKSARTALAELDVGFGIELARAPEPKSIPGAFAHGLAAFQN